MTTLTNKIDARYRYAFVFGAAFFTALLMLLPFLIYDKGFFLYCGDFNSQQIPFTVFTSEWLRGGMDAYSFGIDLGGSVLNAFSFYTIGSPFAMLLALFPASMIPYLMPFMLCVKFGVAAMLGYLYVKRYFDTDGFAVIAAMLYAFSGFAIYNIFFNHFVDPVALFPLLLFALDEFFYEDRRGLFAIAVAINLLNNYFFFTGQVVFLLIYFVVKVIIGDYRLDLKRFLFIAAESIIGVMVGAILAIPAFVSLLDNPRSIKQASGFNLLLHGTSQQYAAILSSMFLPPDPPYLPNIFQDGVIKWTSMSAYIPVFSIAGVVTFFRSVSRNSIKIILSICLIMALVPILNSAFYALNSSYYARWYYMPILLMALATAKAAEKHPKELIRNIMIVGAIILCYSAFGLVPSTQDGEDVMGVVSTQPMFWLTLGTALFGLLLGFLWLKFFNGRRNSSMFLLVTICVFSILYGAIHIGRGKIPQIDNDKYYKAETYDMMDSGILSEDTEFYRVDSYETYDNATIFMGLNGLQYFNSVVTPSILEFYPSVDVKRDVSSKPEWENYALRSLLSVKYLLVPTRENDGFVADKQRYGFVYYDTVGEFTIYENELFLPMGLVFDSYMTEENFENTSESLRSNLLLRGVMLSEEQIEKYSDLRQLTEPELTSLSYEGFVEDIQKMPTATEFTDTGNGFTAEVTTQNAAMVMFSVPYDKGFTAYVNGVETEIENVNNGLSAVMVGTGEHQIVFEYETPYLKLSLLLAVAGIALLAAYLVIDHVGRKDVSAKK